MSSTSLLPPPACLLALGLLRVDPVWNDKNHATGLPQDAAIERLQITWTWVLAE